MESEQTHASDKDVDEALERRRLSRRRLLIGGATSGASVGVVLASSALAQAQTPPQATPGATPPASGAAAGGAQTNPGFEYFTPFQAGIVTAAAARINPDRRQRSRRDRSGSRVFHRPAALVGVRHFRSAIRTRPVG